MIRVYAVVAVIPPVAFFSCVFVDRITEPYLRACSVNSFITILLLRERARVCVCVMPIVGIHYALTIAAEHGSFQM